MWANLLIEQRPFKSDASLKVSAAQIWFALDAEDWLEAFHSHPKIGEQRAARPTTEEAQSWSEQEQAATRNAAAETMAELAKLNREYEEKFGFIFIICATGKTSAEMLALLRERLKNNRDQELIIAAAEQAKITELRINKLLKL